MSNTNANILTMSKVIGKCPRALGEALKTLSPEALEGFIKAYSLEADKYTESCKRNPNPESSGKFIERNLKNLYKM